MHMVGVGQWLDLILVVFSNLNDYVISVRALFQYINESFALMLKKGRTVTLQLPLSWPSQSMTHSV